MTIAKPTDKFKSKASIEDASKYELTPPDTGFESQTVTSDADGLLPNSSQSSECSSLLSAKRALVPTAAACLIVLTILAISYSLFFSKAVMLPIVGAFLLNFLLSPVVAKLNKIGIPNFLGSMCMMAALIGGLALALFFAYDPATRWIENKDQNMKIVETKLLSLKQPFDAFYKMTKELEEIGSGNSDTAVIQTKAEESNSDKSAPATKFDNGNRNLMPSASSPVIEGLEKEGSENGVTRNDETAKADQDDDKETVTTSSVIPVEVRLPSISNRIFSTSGDVLAGVGLMLVLLFYLLSAGDRGLEKLVELMPSFAQKKRTVELSRAIEHSVSSYMLTTFTINLVLGIVIGVGMWAIGLPNPILWGLIAMQLNFFPFLGAMAGAILVFLVAVISFDSVAYAFWAPGIYLVANLIEANLITPHVLGRSVSLHPVWLMIFFVIVSWIWGLGGAIIAVPILAVIKISCDHIEPLEPIGQFLGR